MSNRHKVRLSIIVPAYKEEAVIDESLRKIKTFLKKEKLLKESEVIVVAADSDDNTAKIAKKWAKENPNFYLLEPGPKVGKGRDVKHGMEFAKGRTKIFTDADLATPIKHVKPALKHLEKKGGIVIGSRRLRDVHNTRKRQLTSVLSNALIQLVLLPGIRDTQCGFKGFTHDAAETVFSRQTVMQWGFDFEILKIARKHGIKIHTQKIPDWSDPKGDMALVGESTLMADLRTLRELVNVRWNAWVGRYK